MQKAIIITGPSGTGKSTLAEYLLSVNPYLSYSVSATTREPRNGENNSIDYHFTTINDFKNKIENQEVIEWQQVYEGIYYGTLKAEIEKIWQQNKVVLFVVDVFGAETLQKYFKKTAITIFIKAPNTDVVKQRLQIRNTESQEKIDIRLKKGKIELKEENNFNISIINDDLQIAQQQIKTITDYFIKY